MGLRFRRSVKIAPGIRLNVSKSGLGVSAGPRGAKIGVGPRGMHRTVGLPGTGLHYREQAGWGKAGGRATSGPQSQSVQIALQEDGSVRFLDEADQPLPSRAVKQLRESRGEELQRWLEVRCEAWNEGIGLILTLHHDTPDPDRPLVFEPRPFDEEAPLPPEPRKTDLLARLWRGRRERIEAENLRAQAAFHAALSAWRRGKEAHERGEDERRRRFEAAQRGEPRAMEEFLEGCLAALDWPRETLVSFDLLEDARAVRLDVDLPEVEDMPARRAEVAARGVKINVREKSPTQIQKEYAAHVHAVLFRLLGEVFAALPGVERATVSGYSQRPDPATAEIRDDYLLSVRVPRDAWRQINFAGLEALDLFACVERFEHRRRMTRAGRFSPIEPFT